MTDIQTRPLIERFFTVELAGKHPFDAVEWTKRDTQITDASGKVYFEQKDMYFPAGWSDDAVRITASKYFKGPLGTAQRETSLKQLISRVVNEIAKAGVEQGVLEQADRASGDSEARIFCEELTYLLLNQYAAFNSPVWFNCGVKDERSSGWRWYGRDLGPNKELGVVGPQKVKPGEHRPQCSACFIVSVEDSMESILDWVKTEGMIFKQGSGSGANLSKIRSSREMLSSGSRPSGPLEFMKINDQAAGSIKSGGKHRRAAKMVILNSDHPDIFEFVRCKANEERKIKALVKAGWKDDFTDPNGAQASAFFQNANHAISVDDEFMERAEKGLVYGLRKVTDKSDFTETIKARQLLRATAEAAWACGDPGIQFRDTMNKWNVVAVSGRINGTNPCCFVGNTLVDTSEGKIPFELLESLYANGRDLPHVFAYDHKTNSPVLRKIKRVWQAGSTRRLVEVTTDKGLTLRCTEDHPFLIRRTGEYVCAADLKPGTPLRKIGRGINEQRSNRRYIYHKATNRSPKGCSYQARWMWEQVNGAIPEGYEVHHKNENPEDDRLSNFELKEEAAHLSFHSTGSRNARYVEVPDATLVEVWEAIEVKKHKVTPALWNKYIRRAGLLGGIPTANSTGIRGLSWKQFTEWIDARRPVVNDRVLSVTFVDLAEPAPVFDMEVEGVHNFAVTSDVSSVHSIVVHNSEYVFLDDSSCNLASLNLMKFRLPDGSFNVAGFSYAVALMITAQEILVDMGSYPTKQICQNSHDFRPLGLGYCNLGALLMANGMPYDSDQARNLAGEITALMTGYAYYQSIQIAKRMGPFPEWEENRESALRVIGLHLNTANTAQPFSNEVRKIWRLVAAEAPEYGFRNAQTTVLAPTGTIGFMMDCDTTGIEPELNLVKYKNLVGGGQMKIVNKVVGEALKSIHCGTPDRIIKYIEEHGYVEGSGVGQEDLPVFDTAFPAGPSKRSIPYMGHIKMMAAVQPFLSGAISKTVNMPETAAVEDIEEAHMQAWKLGLKAIAIYRNNCKSSQPFQTKSDAEKGDVKVATVDNVKDVYSEGLTVGMELGKKLGNNGHRKLVGDRMAIVHEFAIAGHKGYMTVGMYDDGMPGEIFVDVSKEGSTISGLLDTIAILTSFCLQYGVPLEKLVGKFKHTKFEPAGITSNPKIRMADSVVDYLFRYLEARFVTPPAEKEVSSAALQGAAADMERSILAAIPDAGAVGQVHDKILMSVDDDAPICMECGNPMVRNGACHKCLNCGGTSGCS